MSKLPDEHIRIPILMRYFSGDGLEWFGLATLSKTLLICFNLVFLSDLALSWWCWLAENKTVTYVPRVCVACMCCFASIVLQEYWVCLDEIVNLSTMFSLDFKALIFLNSLNSHKYLWEKENFKIKFTLVSGILYLSFKCARFILFYLVNCILYSQIFKPLSIKIEFVIFCFFGNYCCIRFAARLLLIINF